MIHQIVEATKGELEPMKPRPETPEREPGPRATRARQLIDEQGTP